MKKSDMYLERLRKEAEHWAKVVDEIPGDTINANDTRYRMSVNAANKYAAARYMKKLMEEEAK